ncbi:hypothetical protein lerEdw1_000420 [Lerista edwardsae]|nr:hypothetical protein lerEdw1_000420 [Lerista edwardsae]
MGMTRPGEEERPVPCAGGRQSLPHKRQRAEDVTPEERAEPPSGAGLRLRAPVKKSKAPPAWTASRPPGLPPRLRAAAPSGAADLPRLRAELVPLPKGPGGQVSPARPAGPAATSNCRSPVQTDQLANSST